MSDSSKENPAKADRKEGEEEDDFLNDDTYSMPPLVQTKSSDDAGKPTTECEEGCFLTESADEKAAIDKFVKDDGSKKEGK